MHSQKKKWKAVDKGEKACVILGKQTANQKHCIACNTGVLSGG